MADMEGIDDLLIATSRHVFALQRGILNPIHYGWGRYYGITWDEKYIYVAAGGTRRMPRMEGTESILVLKPNFEWIGEFQGLNLIYLHQIHYFDGQLFICNTGRNRVVIVTAVRAEDKYAMYPLNCIEYSIKGWITERGNDRLWINSVWTDGDGIYVIENRRGPSKVKHFNNKFEFLGVFTGLGDKIHNVYVEDGKMFVCSSEAECIIIRDLSTGKDRMISTGQYVRGFPRGLARTQGRWYIGVSRRAPRSERHLGDGYILIFDDDFNLMHNITLKNVGQVCEIRAMTGLDRAHNGIPFPKSSSPTQTFISSSYNVPSAQSESSQAHIYSSSTAYQAS